MKTGNLSVVVELVNNKFNKAAETDVKLGGIWTGEGDEDENQGAIDESVADEN
jgi:hypothetical protein